MFQDGLPQSLWDVFTGSHRVVWESEANRSLAGKLAAEYLKEKNYPVKWGVCGRNEQKVRDILGKLGVECPVEVADLVGAINHL